MIERIPAGLYIVLKPRIAVADIRPFFGSLVKKALIILSKLAARNVHLQKHAVAFFMDFGKTYAPERVVVSSVFERSVLTDDVA